MSKANIIQVSRSGAAANRPAVTGMVHRGITLRKAARSMHGRESPAPTTKWVMAEANSVQALHDPAIDGDRNAGDVAGTLARQENHDVGKLFRPSYTAERRLRCPAPLDARPADPFAF